MKSRLTALGLLCAGAVGAALRVWALKTAYEPLTKLAIPGAASLTALILYAIAVPLLALAGSLWLRRDALAGNHTLYSGLSRPMSALGAAAAAVLTTGSFLRLMDNASLAAGGGGKSALSSAVVDGLMLAAGLCMLWMSLGGQRISEMCHDSILPLAPGFAGCLALVVYYQNNSRDPGVTHYCWILLCLMASVLALYHQAGYAFDNPHPVRAQWATLTAGAYALLALPDADSPGELLLLLGAARVAKLDTSKRLPRRGSLFLRSTHGQSGAGKASLFWLQAACRRRVTYSRIADRLKPERCARLAGGLIHPVINMASRSLFDICGHTFTPPVDLASVYLYYKKKKVPKYQRPQCGSRC